MSAAPANVYSQPQPRRTPLRDLTELILRSVDTIESSCERRGVDLPSLDEPFTPESEAFRADPDVLAAIQVLTSAAYQLLQVGRSPHISLLYEATGVWHFFESHSLDCH